MKHKRSLSVLFFALFIMALWGQVVAPGAQLQELALGFAFTEGPAKAPDGNIYFTDQPNDRILIWQVDAHKLSTFLSPCGRSNGLYFDHDGALLACADEHNQLWRISMQGEHTVLIDSVNGALLNAPNDLWIDQWGGVYFTDPLYRRSYWTRQGPFLEECVYYLSPDGHLQQVAEGFRRPNGIIGDDKRQHLYVSDIDDDKIWVYDIDAPGVLSHKRLFAPMGSDGMTIDRKRNIYLTNKKGVYVYNQSGKLIDLIEVPQDWTANVTIGGPKNKTLYITASKGLYAISLRYKGLY